MLTTEQIFKDTEQIEQLGEVYSDYKAAYTYLEDTKKTVFAKCFFESTETSIEAKRQDAARSIEYVSHLGELSKAQSKMLKSKVKYDTAITRMEMIRSMESTARKLL